MIGKKLYKNNPDDMAQYTETAQWCNKNNAHIEDKGEYYEVIENPSPTLEELKEAKHQELKSIRDTREVEDITVNGNTFDYDDKARERINAAIIALDLHGEEATIAWTLADNTSTAVTSADLKQVIGAVALRSDALHTTYRELIERLEACTTSEEVSAIVWEANE